MIMEEEKKVERKRKRFTARLKSSKGVTCTDNPSPYLVICNAGQATGLQKDVIQELIERFPLEISVPKLIAEKGETYSYLVFKCTEDAVLFFNHINGKTVGDGSSTVFYLNFVESVPNTEVTCPHSLPTGLTLLDDFINKEEEKEFIKLFDFQTPSNNLKNRQVKHYGYEFRYGINDVDLSSPLVEKIPSKCDVLWQRLRVLGFDVGVPDQMTVNKYCPGQGIPSHVDKHSPFGPTILSLSLGADVVMEWRHVNRSVPVVVKARAMMVMQGEARYDWQHGIQPRTHDPVITTRQHDHRPTIVITDDTIPRGTRISLTFRWTRSGDCDCGYKRLCDSVKEEEIGDDVASSLEEMHVHQVYEQIASHFSSTRHTVWPRVRAFASRASAGDVLLDLGAGNGKNLLQRGDLVQIAGERSSGLISECRSRLPSCPAVKADCVRLDLLHAGLRDQCADLVLCIAVIHHFCNEARRIQSISTIARLLRPGGQALITVWAKDQKTSNYLCKNKNKMASEPMTVTAANGVTLPVHENRTEFKHNDLLVPWKLRRKTDDKISDQPESTLLRYYHVFEDGELRDLCEKVPGLVVEEHFYEEGNWCVVVKKI